MIKWHGCTWASRRLAGIGLVIALAFAAPAHAFDTPGYTARVNGMIGELEKQTLPDAKATLARLDEMIALGVGAAREYAVRAPKFAALMQGAIADTGTMKASSDAELEDKWGESGSGGDAAGVALKSLGQFDETRAYLELMIAPATTYIMVNKWQSAKRARWLDQGKDEMTELLEHLKKVH